MKVRQSIWFVLVVGLIVSACSPKSPEFKDVKNLEFSMTGFTSGKLTGDALFFNPNGSSLTVNEIHLEVHMEEEVVASLSDTFNITSKAKSDFTLPFEIDLSLKNLNINSINSALSMLSGAEKDMYIKGYITAKMYGVNFKIPIDHHEKMKLN